MASWVDLSVLLSDNEEVRADAAEHHSRLVKSLEKAIIKPVVSQEVEDYSIICICVPEDVGVDRLLVYEGQGITQLVNAEARPLHTDVVAETLAGRISWYADHAAFVGWPAAALFSDGSDESREFLETSSNALEFVNMQLLQFEILSKQLDRSMLRAYQIPDTGYVSKEDQRELDELTMDCVELFGRVGSGLKIFSNIHLAHMLKAVARRFEFQDRITEIRGKLADLRTIRYGIVEASRHRQSHLVEILIAGLIVIELLPFLFRMGVGVELGD
jgi:hypothetical protein